MVSQRNTETVKWKQLNWAVINFSVYSHFYYTMCMCMWLYCRLMWCSMVLWCHQMLHIWRMMRLNANERCHSTSLQTWTPSWEGGSSHRSSENTCEYVSGAGEVRWQRRSSRWFYTLCFWQLPVTVQPRWERLQTRAVSARTVFKTGPQKKYKKNCLLEGSCVNSSVNCPASSLFKRLPR